MTMKAALPVHAIMATPEMEPDVMVRTRLSRLATIINLCKQILMNVLWGSTTAIQMLHAQILWELMEAFSVLVTLDTLEMV